MERRELAATGLEDVNGEVKQTFMSYACNFSTCPPSHTTRGRRRAHFFILLIAATAFTPTAADFMPAGDFSLTDAGGFSAVFCRRGSLRILRSSA